MNISPRSHPRRGVLARVLIAASAAAALTVAAPAPASAGVDKCAGAAAKAGTLYLSHLKNCGEAGTYHYTIKAGDRTGKTNNHAYDGKQLIFRVPFDVPAGTPICAELWYHEPGSERLTSMGRPCTVMRPATTEPQDPAGSGW
ncbi:hypothetical protein [Bailinhaonella thermotolerans]|uniref:Secreted protein n=1 Tax=Bailinhaonella thermotolerans TaxID=1070861 RepID=A0A3A4BBN9_9ACTN|nr:hypothetical protein [Bailinhaonella thermotolerans]RJL35953.1 hypothetical protein D5H75_04070 [Bailinhaonella thermotolerans]